MLVHVTDPQSENRDYDGSEKYHSNPFVAHELWREQQVALSG